MPIRLPFELRSSLRRNDNNALVSYVSFHALSHGEARLLEPIAAQAQVWNFGWPRPAAIQLISVAGAGDTQQAGLCETEM